MATNVKPNKLQRGMLSSYADAFIRERRIEDETLEGVVMDDSQDARTQTYGHFLPAAHMEYQPYGEPVNEADLDGRDFEITIYQYSRRIKWLRKDREHEQTRSLPQAAEGAGTSAANMKWRGFIDLMKDQTSFLPYVPNAADGLAAYSSSTRYERSGGNITSGHTLTTQAGVRSMVATVDEVFRAFNDPWGEPLLSESTLRSTMKIFYGNNAAQNLAFQEAFNLPIVEGTTKAAATSNILTAQYGGRKYELVQTSRLSAGEVYCFLTGAKAPFIMTTDGPILPTYGDNSNSDDARTNAIEYVQWEQCAGFGIGEVFGTVKATT